MSNYESFVIARKDETLHLREYEAHVEEFDHISRGSDFIGPCCVLCEC